MDERHTSIREMLAIARASLLGRGRYMPPGHAEVRDPHIGDAAAHRRPRNPLLQGSRSLLRRVGAPGCRVRASV
jgi:hypothetical protein